MPKLTKRKKKIAEMLGDEGREKQYSMAEALQMLKKVSKETGVAFVESVDVSLNLGIEARKSDQSVRGAAKLPHGLGKEVRVAVFTRSAVEDAQKAGADIVGSDDLAADIKADKIEFDVLIATPDAMADVGKLGQKLGPNKLMPNPKVGTVTRDVTTAVQDAKAGKATFKNDKNGILHCSVGRINFSDEQIIENIAALVEEVKRKKPNTAKGTYLKKLVISTSMGPGLRVELPKLN